MAPAGRNQALALGAEQLTPRQRQAALLLAQGALPHAVAAQIPVGVSTLRRWRQAPGFQAELTRHLAAAEADAHAQLLGYSDMEHLMVAAIARYHRRSLPKKRHESWQLIEGR